MIQVAAYPDMVEFLDHMLQRIRDRPTEKWQYRDWRKVRIYSFKGRQIYGIADRGPWDTGYYLEPQWRKILGVRKVKP